MTCIVEQHADRSVESGVGRSPDPGYMDQSPVLLASNRQAPNRDLGTPRFDGAIRKSCDESREEL